MKKDKLTRLILPSKLDFVTIPRDVFYALQTDSRWLRALEEAGVRDWKGFSYTKEIYKKMLTKRN